MSTQPQYEFTPEQNKIIEQLSRSMRTVALFMLVVGVLYVFAFIATVAHAIVHPVTIGQAILFGLVVVFYFLVCRWTDHAAISFRRVVQTTGQDISHLMNAIDNLRKIYLLMSTIIKVYVVLIIISLVIMLILLFTILT